MRGEEGVLGTKKKGGSHLRRIGARPLGRPTSGGPERKRSGGKPVPQGTNFFRKRIFLKMRCRPSLVLKMKIQVQDDTNLSHS